jgi:serine/threonine protein phosphatase PrpC
MKALEAALAFASRTDPGMVRSNNEDSVFVGPDLGLAILADGMGGANAGEVASGMATTLLATDLKQALPGLVLADAGSDGESRAFGVLRDKIAVANNSIFRAAESQPQYSGMGTTLVVALFYGDRMAVAHIGDSRLYRWRAGTLAQLTRDHSFLQLQLDAGVITPEEARGSKHKNLVTRMLGVDAEVEPEIHEHRVQQGDIYVLCSDGLHDMVDEHDIALTLGAPAVNLEAAARQLIQMANDNGGKDNVSVILVKILQDVTPPKGWWRRLLASLK